VEGSGCSDYDVTADDKWLHKILYTCIRLYVACGLIYLPDCLCLVSVLQARPGTGARSNANGRGLVYDQLGFSTLVL